IVINSPRYVTLDYRYVLSWRYLRAARTGRMTCSSMIVYSDIVYDLIYATLSIQSGQMSAASSATAGRLAGLTPLVAKSLVNQVVDAIVEAAAKGVFLPGDRIVEAELARSLNVSRIPVR